ncbi:hypothetical protein cce_0709 [Crocosphaera subtropica ATCC 51142]|uniref:Uncharacterized protein n=1 Tax=Crocosphaera subtropica (strain ATCC 51142 / BH68) TaxID=43989 RepID=B1WR02_CROS5|nr:hypothetical protein cce_0709 [Crocosphaera subtropica ATCC 51142]
MLSFIKNNCKKFLHLALWLKEESKNNLNQPC